MCKSVDTISGEFVTMAVPMILNFWWGVTVCRLLCRHVLFAHH